MTVMQRTALVLGILHLLTALALAEVPPPYREVDSLDWVVEDLDEVASGWEGLGFPVSRLGEGTVRIRIPGMSDAIWPVRAATANLAGFRVVWIQPLGESGLRDALEARTDGVHSVNHRFEEDAAEREVVRMAGLGVPVIRILEFSVGGLTRRVDNLGTRPRGKVTVGIVRSDGLAYPEPGTPPPGFRPSQYAFVVRELEPVSEYWARLGLPEFQVTHGALSNLRYRGAEAAFDQRLGWQRHGRIVYEWIEPLLGPNVYDEALRLRGEGFHHLAFDVADMDEAIRFFEERGFPCSQSGAWGEVGKPGSGRFAYIDTEKLGGITLELLWNHR